MLKNPLEHLYGEAHPTEHDRMSDSLHFHCRAIIQCHHEKTGSFRQGKPAYHQEQSSNTTSKYSKKGIQSLSLSRQLSL